MATSSGNVNNTSLLLCPLLCNAKFLTQKRMLQHVRTDHSFRDYHRGFTCKKIGCNRSFHTYQSFKVHFLHYHNKSKSVPFATSEASSSSIESVTTIGTGSGTGTSNAASTSIQVPSGDALGGPSAVDNEISDECNNFLGFDSDYTNAEAYHKKFSEEFCLFYLKIREEHVLPVSIVKDIMDDFVLILNLYRSSCEKIMECSFDGKCVNVEKLWDNLQKESFYMTFCKSLGLVEPVTITLSSHTTGEKDSFQYVPILKTLKHYLSHEDVLNSIDKTKNQLTRTVQNATNLLQDFSDGSYFKSNSFFQGNYDFLRLVLYCDELEICNAIGDARVLHKLTCLYFLVSNIESKYLPNVKNTHLLAIVPSRLLKKYGYWDILKAIDQDIHVLENEGITISLNNQMHHFKGGVSGIAGDNLGSHDLGGFRRSFSSERICRFCMCTYQDIFSKFDESHFLLRSQSMHDLHESYHHDLSLVAAYGVRAKNPLPHLLSFHPVTSLPPDIHHDILEGIMPLCIECIFEQFHADNILPKSQFFARLQNFGFLQNDKMNSPKNWCFSRSISASKMWCLFRMLPFIVGDKVPRDNSVWEIYLKLSSISEIVFAPVVHVEWISYLKVQIQEFYELFLLHFPSKVKPKMHFLLHYPSLMLKFIPLQKFWCMRFESFHQKAKKIIKRTENYINVAYSISSRLQKLKCWQLCGVNCLGSSSQHSTLKKVVLSSAAGFVQSYFQGLCLTSENAIYSVKFLRFNERSYHVNDILILHIDENIDELSFFLVSDIYQFSNQWYLAGEIMLNDSFSNHLHCHVVRHSGFYHVLPAGSELNHQALDMYNIFDALHIRLKYRIASTEPE